MAGYKQIIDRAHAHGIRFVAVTLTPFIDTFKGTPLSGYYTPEKEKLREEVNAWIRSNKMADGLIDFDKVVEDPNNPKHINPRTIAVIICTRTMPGIKPWLRPWI